MKKLLFLAILFVLCCDSARSGDAEPVLRVAVESNWPPMEFRNESGDLVGLTPDYLQAVAEEAGFRVEFLETPWDTIFDGLLDGEYDMVASSVSITPERLRDMDFSLPYFTVRQTLIARKGAQVASADDLADWRIGVQMGTTGNFTAQTIANLDLVEYTDILKALSALDEGQLDGVLCDSPVAAAYAFETADSGNPMEIIHVFESDTPEQYGFAVRKGRTDIVDLLNRGILVLQAKGLDKELERKWLKGD